MKRYYNIFVAITILLTGSSFLSAECVDDPNGTVAAGPAADCSTGHYDTSDDGFDYDGDGQCDDDNDGCQECWEYCY